MSDSNDDDSSFDSWAWREKSLWERMSDWLKPQEVDEVRRAIGHSIIERNNALRSEVASLNEIVEDFRKQNYERAEARQAQIAKRRDLLSASGERKLLEQQIRLLLREAGPLTKGSSGAGGKQQSSDSRVVDYVLGGGGGAASVPSSARPTSALSTSRSSGGRASARSCPTLVLEDGFVLDRGRNGNGEGGGGSSQAQKSLTADRLVGDVVQTLRAAFKDEETELLAEVAELTALFDEEDEALTRQEAEARARQDPSTSELREFSSKLQKETLRAPVTQRLIGDNNSSSHGIGSREGRGAAHGMSGRARLPGLRAPLGLPASRPASLAGTTQASAGSAEAVAVPALDLSFGSSHRSAHNNQADCGSTSSDFYSEEKDSSEAVSGVDYLRRPPLPEVGKGSKFSSRIKATLNDAQESMLSARDTDYHLSADFDDERFLS